MPGRKHPSRLKQRCLRWEMTRSSDRERGTGAKEHAPSRTFLFPQGPSSPSSTALSFGPLSVDRRSPHCDLAPHRRHQSGHCVRSTGATAIRLSGEFLSDVTMKMLLTEGTATTISDLPDDCLVFIFERLDSACAREAFGLTCRRWMHIQNRSRVSLQFYCSFTKSGMPSKYLSSELVPSVGALHLNRLLTRFQHLQFLSLSGCTELPDSGLLPMQNYGPSLRGLYLDCCFCITDSGFSFVGRGCPSLTFISLYRCSITDAGLETLARSCSTLKSVNLSHCSLITDHGIKALSENCPELSAVKITSCGKVNGTGFRGCSQNFAYLEAESCNLVPEGIASIVSGGGLEYLDISILSWCIHGDGLVAIGAGSATMLRVLSMRLCRTVGDDSIAAIAKGCPLLQEWNLALCHEVGIPGWEAIAANCNSLKKLHVNRCRKLCDVGLMAIRNGCRGLSVLYMNGCPQVSSNAIEFFKLMRGDVVIEAGEVLTMCPLPRLFG